MQSSLPRSLWRVARWRARGCCTGSPLGGEMTGHLFFADDYYGYDDGLYAAVRLIRAARPGRSVTDLRGAMPDLANTPELRFPVAEDRKFAVIDEILARLCGAGADVNAIDGARVRTADGWWLTSAHTQDHDGTRRNDDDLSCTAYL